MVKSIKRINKRYYQCGICELVYENKSWAGKCEAWCRENKSCNLEITKHAVKEQ